MPKLKEFPRLAFKFTKTLFKGDFDSCINKVSGASMYFLDKTLKNDSLIRYSIWKIKNKKKLKIESKYKTAKFAIIYFYENSFNTSIYKKLIAHLNCQTYKNFEVFIASKNIDDILNEIKAKDCNYICFIEQNDFISAHALSSIACEIENNPELGIIYTDEDETNLFGIRVKPYFKPQYAPLLMLSHNYMNAFLCLRLSENAESKLKSLKKINQNSLYELLLELADKTSKVKRIPDVLYHRHWKNAKRIKNTSTKSIVEHEIKRKGLNAEVVDYKVKGFNKVKFCSVDSPLISIIIPFKDKVGLLKNCVTSIEEKSTYKNYEIILVNNRSQEQETLDYLKQSKHRVLDADIDFNYSKLNNMAAKIAKGDYLLLLNNDTEVITSDWLENMLALAQLPQVGAVGTKLLYPNNTVQHAGARVRMGKSAAHINRFLQTNAGGYNEYNNIIREYSSVTGACLMVAKEKYWQVDGLTEVLAVQFNDIDFCLKLLEQGYYNLYTPFSVLYHYEKTTRKSSFGPSLHKEYKYMETNWLKYMSDDPWYNPNFSYNSNSFCIKLQCER